MKCALVQTFLVASFLLPSSVSEAATEVSTNKVVLDGLELRDLRCSIKNKPTDPIVTPVAKAIAQHKKALEACDPAGGTYAVGFKWKGGKLRTSAVRKASNRKSKRCVAKLLKKVNPSVEGSCRTTIIIKKSALAPKAEPTPKTEQKPKPKTEQKPKPKTEQKPKPKTEQKPKPKTEPKDGSKTP